MAIVIRPFPGVPDGQTQVRQFDIGDTVTGDLADVAIAEGWAVDDAPAAVPLSERLPLDQAALRAAIARVSDPMVREIRAAWRWLQLRAAAIAAAVVAAFAKPD